MSKKVENLFGFMIVIVYTTKCPSWSLIVFPSSSCNSTNIPVAIYPSVTAFLSADLIIAHNVKFDIGFLIAEFNYQDRIFRYKESMFEKWKIAIVSESGIYSEKTLYNKELNAMLGRKNKNRYVYGDKVIVEVIKASRETAQVDFRIIKKAINEKKEKETK